MSKLFVDVYDESGDATRLIDGQQLADPVYLEAEVLEQFRESDLYRANDYIYFRNPSQADSHERWRIPLGSDRYLLYWQEP